jgi:hypothetical protein
MSALSGNFYASELEVYERLDFMCVAEHLEPTTDKLDVVMQQEP